MGGISVILCCYNSSKRLPKTLKYLANQKVSKNLNWELVLVNNNSSDNTSIVAQKLWENYDTDVPLNIVDESKAGLSFARDKGIKTAKFDILLFCDDDNWLDSNYIDNVFDKFKKHPNLGAVGGWCDAVFEGEKPEWFDLFSGNFAVGRPMEKSGFLEKPNSYLYGAGMALSRQAYKHLVKKGFKNILTDRKGKQLSSGGDVELIYALRLIGYDVYFDDELHFYHYMPDQRMSWEYLNRLRESMYWSNFVLGIYIDVQMHNSLTTKRLSKKIKNDTLFIVRKTNDLKKLDKFKVLFLKNQIEVRKLFLKNILFYLRSRKKIKLLRKE